MGSCESKKEQTADEYQTEVKLRNYDNLEEELNRTKKALSTTETEYDECSKQLALDKANNTREIGSLKSKITTYEKQISDLNAKVKELNKLTNVEKQLKETEKKYKELTTQYVQCMDHGCDDEHNARLRLQAENNTLNLKLTNYINTSSNSTDELKAQKAENDNLRNTIAELNNNIHTKQETINKAEKSKLEIEAKYKEVMDENTSLRDKMANVNQKVSGIIAENGVELVEDIGHETKINTWIEQLIKLTAKTDPDETIRAELRKGVIEEIDQQFVTIIPRLDSASASGVEGVIDSIKEKFEKSKIYDLIYALRKCQASLTSRQSALASKINGTKIETFMINSQMNENEREYLAIVVLVFVLVLLIYHFRYEIYGLLTGKIRFINLLGSGNGYTTNY